MPAKFLGWVALACSAFGFWYTLTTLPLALRGEFDPILHEFGTDSGGSVASSPVGSSLVMKASL